MGLTTKQRHIAQLNEEIRDPKTTPVTFRKRCRTLLELYPSRRHSTFVNHHILARLLSDDIDVREAAEKFQKELINKTIRDFSLRRRQLVASERQKLGIDPVPTAAPVVPTPIAAPPPGAIGKAPASDGFKYWVDAEGTQPREGKLMTEDNAPILDLNAVEPVLDLSEFEPVPHGIKDQTAPRSEPAVVLSESREQELAHKNRHWNAEPVPQKWLYFYEYSDLAPYGIPDAIGDERRLFVDDDPGFGGPKRLMNPLYLDGYRLWKQKRFPHGLPSKTSVWRVRYEHRYHVDQCPGLLAEWPREYPVGEECRKREHQRGEVALWEEPYCKELHFEIQITPREEFVAASWIDDTTESYYKAREHERSQSPKSAEEYVRGDITEQLPQHLIPGRQPAVVPQTDLRCVICDSASAVSQAPPSHDCEQFRQPITVGLRRF